ncbi:MAG: hypothetical protein DRJ07_03975 [Bacteroidetes bacterium]|nr:MAG: hypothetical protein DRJ07_03975 [Bacteroidota bacterium]
MKLFRSHYNKLKKLRASTIIETLVASVIIIIIFTIASLTLNNISKGLVKKDTSIIDNRFTKLIYLHRNNKIEIPHQEDFYDWEINIEKETIDRIPILSIKANNINTNRTVQKIYIYDGVK